MDHMTDETTAGDSGAGFRSSRSNAVEVTAASALLVSALIHVGAAWGHRRAGGDHVTFFLAAAAAQFVLAGRALRHWDATARAASALVSVSLLATWLVSRTIGLGTYGQDEVGLADAVCAAFELVVLALAVVPTVSIPSVTRRTAALIGATAALAVGIAVPAAARGHGPVSGGSTASISAVWAGAGRVHGALSGNGIVHDTNAACAPKAAEVAAADRLVAATTLALRRYDDVNVALEEGFRPLGFEPNGLYHYISRSFAADAAVLDPKKPESIVYGRSLDGSLRPVGVMYMMPGLGDRDRRHGPRPGGCLMTWHTHGFPFARLGQESTEMVHVWTVPVPGGPFAHEAGPDWARVYLGRKAVDPAEINRLFAKAEHMVRTGTVDLVALADYRVLTKPMAERCAAAGRASMTRLGMGATLQEQFCDTLLGRTLPGAEGRSLLSDVLGGGV